MFFAEKLLPPSPAALVFAGDHILSAWLFYGALIAIFLFAVHVVRTTNALRPVKLWLALIWILFQVPHFAIERPDIAHLTQHTGAFILALLVIEGAPAARFLIRAARIAIAVYVLLFVAHCIAKEQGGARRWPPRDVYWHRLSNGLEFPTLAKRDFDQLIEAVLAKTAPDDSVANWPYAPGANFLAQRRMPGRRVFVTPEAISPEIELELIEDLESEEVAVVLYRRDFSMHDRKSSLPSNFMPRLDAYLAKQFVESARYEEIQVLRPKSSMASPER